MRPLGHTATTLLVLVYLGAGLAVLQGFVGAGLPIHFGASLVAQVSGMAAGYGAAVMLISMSRAPWLERGVGAHRLARWHAWGAPLVIILTRAACQCGGSGLGEAQIDRSARSDDEVLSLPGLITALVGTVILVLIGVASLRGMRRRISYERWHLLHLLTYLAVGLGFAHQLAGPDLVGRQVVADCLGAAVLLCLRAGSAMASVPAGFQLWRHRLRVEDVRQESEDVMSVLMSGQHLDELRAEPGQFFRWRFLTRRDVALGVPLLPFCTTDPPSASDHHQGQRRRDAAAL